MSAVVENKTELKMSAKTATKMIVVEEENELQEDNISETESVAESVAVSKVSADDEIDAELEEQEKLIAAAMAKAEQLRMKKQLLKRSGEFLEKLKVSKNEELEKLNEEILRLESLKEKVEEEVETLDGIDEDEDDVMAFLVENYADFVNTIAFPKTEEPVAKKPSVATKKTPVVEGEKKKGTRTAIDRKAYPAMLLDRMVFQASGNHKTDKARGKITMEVVFNAATKKFYNRTTKTEYEFLQDANRVWCNERGYEKLGNAWEDFRALDLKTKKTRSIAILHQDNWIADSITEAQDFIDKKFKF